MGQEISTDKFTDEDDRVFRERLRDETKILKRWFEERAFDHDDRFTVGLELEAWLLDENHIPTPRNEEFLSVANDPDIVEELSKFNFEINSPPKGLGAGTFSETENDLNRIWAKCVRAGEIINVKPIAIGIMPTVRDEMLQPHWMSDTNRFHALNAELFRRRNGAPLHICIEGHDELDYECNNIMLEAACTSLQSHLKINQENAVRLYNASIIAAAPLVAASANSPYLYGKCLWAETRIPAFEQSTELESFRDVEGRNVLRVTLGRGYIRNSMLELFIRNLDYPNLLPALSDTSNKLPHLRLQNGTVWRWVRPIVGFDKDLNPHLRIEHRVIPAGPSMIDTTANLMLCHGLTLSLGLAESPPEQHLPFEDARQNFYACARNGLDAQIIWNGNRMGVRSLLLNMLLPTARKALSDQGVSEEELVKYFDNVIVPRIETGQNGTVWQRSFIEKNGRNYQVLTERYAELQAAGTPVHTWPV